MGAACLPVCLSGFLPSRENRAGPRVSSTAETERQDRFRAPEAARFSRWGSGLSALQHLPLQTQDGSLRMRHKGIFPFHAR